MDRSCLTAVCLEFLSKGSPQPGDREPADQNHKGAQNATPAQITLSWLLAQKPWIVPIPDDDIRAVAVELTPDDLRNIESAVAQITLEGDRYPEHSKKM